MPSRQPISTLFPYTTLFRSEDAHQPGQLGDADDLLVRDVAEEGVAVERQRVVLAQRVEVDRSLDDLADVAVRDRKSTRLNSSHPSISYAVFCLKKKSNT